MHKEDIKEDFCPSCLIVPLAFAGAGATAAGQGISNSHKKMKKILMLTGVVSVVSTLLLVIYYFLFKNNCSKSGGSCSLKR